MKLNRTYIIGITGGAGCGKTTVVSYISKILPVCFIHCDEISKELLKQGGASYNALTAVYPDILEDNNGKREISKEKLTKLLFSSDATRKKINNIIHPIVREEVCSRIESKKREESFCLIIVEAALLIEAKFTDICDEVWYVYASKDERIKRMKENRGYSDERIEAVLKSQLSEEEFRNAADLVIDNSGKNEKELEAYLEKLMREHFHAEHEE